MMILKVGLLTLSATATAYAQETPKVTSPKADVAITNKAKTAVAAKLKDPASARFDRLERAIRRNLRGEPMDTICGFVNAKNSFGGYSGPKPFLYLVKDGDVYIVGEDGAADTARAIYKNICIDGAR